MSWDLSGNAGTNPQTNFLGTTDNQPLAIRTNGRESVRIDQDGKLSITRGDLEVRAAFDGGGIRLIGSTIGGPKDVGLNFIDEGGRRASLGLASAPFAWFDGTQAGDLALGAYGDQNSVWIGVGAQTSTLQGGQVRVHGTGVDLKGKLDVTGNISAQDVVLLGGDCAEDFDIAGSEAVDAGTVMVLNQEGALQPSEEPYDKKVAGVVSGAGNYNCFGQAAGGQQQTAYRSDW